MIKNLRCDILLFLIIGISFKNIKI